MSHLERYRVIHYNHAAVGLGEVVPLDLEFALYLNRVGYCNYDISLDSHMATRYMTYPYQTDYVLYAGDIPLQGGIHTDVGVEETEGRMLKVSGKDWKHYLEGDWYPFDPANITGPYIATITDDMFTVVEDILTDCLAQPNSLVLTLGLSGVSGQAINGFKIEVGDTESIFAIIEALSQRKPGFDFDITWDRKWMMWAPSRGSTSTFTFETGRNVDELSYVNHGPLGTHTLGKGTGQSSKIGAIYDATNQPFYRRKKVVTDFGDIIRDATTLANMTIAEGERNAALQREVSFKYVEDDPNINPWEILELGTHYPVHIINDYEEIDEDMRLTGIVCNPTNEGDMEVSLSFDDASLSL